MTKTTLHDLTLSGVSALYGEGNGHQFLVFMTADVPDAERILVQTDLAGMLSAAQNTLVHSSLPGHLSVVVTCPEFAVVTIKNARTGKIKKTGTGKGCVIRTLK